MSKKKNPSSRRKAPSPEISTKATTHSPRWPLLLLFTLSCLAYVNADREEMIFDDAQGAIDNADNADLPGTIKSFFARPLAPDQHLAEVTFALNYALNRAIGPPGFDVTGFIAFNVLVHALNSCLLFLLLSKLMQVLGMAAEPLSWPALAAAILFAVHPLHASSVVYILQRRGSMATMFCMIALLAYLSARQTTHLPQRIGWGAAALASCWLAAKCKSMGVTTPFLLLVVESVLRWKEVKRFAWPPITIAATIIVGVLTAWGIGLIPRHTFGVVESASGEMWGAGIHALTEARAFVVYWLLLILPLPCWLCIDHDFELSRTLWHHGAGFALLLHTALLILAIRFAIRGPRLTAIGILWFYVTLSPYAVIPQVEVLVEYKTYMPSIGLFMIVADLLHEIRRVMPRRGQVAIVAACAVLLLTITLTRNRVYHDGLALWSDAVEKYPRAPRPHNALGSALLKRERFDEAIAQFKEAIRLVPGLSAGHANLGMTYFAQKKWPEAAYHLRTAINVNPVEYDGRPYLALGGTLLQLGQTDEAIVHLKEGLRRDPDNADGWYTLANTMMSKNNRDGAIDAYRRVLELRPQYVEASVDFGRALESASKLDDAMAAYDAAVRTLPKSVTRDALFKLHYNRGRALLMLKRSVEAADAFRAALRVDPSHEGAKQGLASAQTAAGR